MFYTHGALDRADHLRKDPKALAELRNKSSTRLIPIWQGTALVSSDTESAHPQIATLDSSQLIENESPIFLGLDDDTAYFAIDTEHLSTAHREQLCGLATSHSGSPIAAEFSDLRVVGPTLNAN